MRPKRPRPGSDAPPCGAGETPPRGLETPVGPQAVCQQGQGAEVVRAGGHPRAGRPPSPGCTLPRTPEPTLDPFSSLLTRPSAPTLSSVKEGCPPQDTRRLSHHSGEGRWRSDGKAPQGQEDKSQVGCPRAAPRQLCWVGRARQGRGQSRPPHETVTTPKSRKSDEGAGLNPPQSVS